MASERNPPEVPAAPAGWGITLFSTYVHWFRARTAGLPAGSLCGSVRRHRGQTSLRATDFRSAGKCLKCEAALAKLKDRQDESIQTIAVFPVGLPAQILERWGWHYFNTLGTDRATVAEFRSRGLTLKLLNEMKPRMYQDGDECLRFAGNVTIEEQPEADRIRVVTGQQREGADRC